MPPEALDAWTDVTGLIELSRPEHRKPEHSIPWRLLQILLLAVLPAVVTAAYFEFVAVDRYVAEAHFVVREPQSATRLSLPSTSFSDMTTNGGNEDSFAVHDFILSRDGLALLEREIGLRNMLIPAITDPAWSFPSLLNGTDEEDLFQYYRKIVSVDYDGSTNVSTLTVQAFRPADAERIATTLLGGAEALLNRMNERARADAIRVAEREVADSRAAALAAQDQLTAYRNREQVVDPLELSRTILATMTTLSDELVNAAADLDVMLHASPNSPHISPLRGRIDALQEQIDRERGVLAGNDRSLAPRISSYERLLLLRSFAEQRYVSAMTQLETARVDAQRQQSYLEQVVRPRVPDHARYPYRLLWPSAALLIGLLLCWLFRPTQPGAYITARGP